jgi:hypothetical protein
MEGRREQWNRISSDLRKYYSDVTVALLDFANRERGIPLRTIARALEQRGVSISFQRLGQFIEKRDKDVLERLTKKENR